jgi:hypothetical protein
MLESCIRQRFAYCRWNLFLFSLLFFVPANALAALPQGKAEIAAAVGNPVSLQVHPDTINLTGLRAMQQIVVTGQYGDKTVRDLTPFATYTIETPAIASVDATGFILPKADGTTNLTIQVGNQKATIPVRVEKTIDSPPVSFRHEMIAAMNVGGCNSGACHGTPSGKNGFKLSLRGFDPDSDYEQLTRDILARRTSRNGPEESLIYLKGLGAINHDGGKRFSEDSIPGKTFHAWLSDGLLDDPKDLPALSNVEVLPGSRLLNQPSRWQQLRVVAHFSNGEARDVTRLTVFSSSDSTIADVANTGLVEFFQSGEVAILCRYLDEMVTVRLTYLEPKEGFVWNNPHENNFVDKHAFAKQKMLNILPSEVCTDAEFIRRAYMDVCGVLPTAPEVRQFLQSDDPQKRIKLVDSLLDRPEYADLWTLKWSDVFRSTRKTIKVKGTHVFQSWMRKHIEKNTGWNDVIEQMLTASGSTFSNPPANYYRIAREPTALAETTAQLFFGVRMQCAKCHNHPFERWTQDDYYSLAAFFARVKQREDPIEKGTQKKAEAEFIYLARTGEVIQPRTGKVMPPGFLGTKAPEIASTEDRRKILAEWITSDQNPFFAKSVVNRVWFHLMGKGIVDPVDDFRDSNPSANDELLDALARDFVEHGFDIKHTIRVIMTSRTYQLSAQTNKFNKDDEKYFSHAVTKLYTAEQLFDALCAVTDVPEAFAGMPPGTRAMQLPDGEFNHPFLKTFGQPERELACECERESESNLAQALQLINGPAVNDRLRNPNNLVGKLLAKKLPDSQMLEELYLTTLSRFPVQGEVQVALAHVLRATDQRKAWEDVHWALINSKEFLFRH